MKHLKKYNEVVKLDAEESDLEKTPEEKLEDIEDILLEVIDEWSLSKKPEIQKYNNQLFYYFKLKTKFKGYLHPVFSWEFHKYSHLKRENVSGIYYNSPIIEKEI